VKYIGEEHGTCQSSQTGSGRKLQITCDWTGTGYISITLDWKYTKRQGHLSMPNYVTKALKQFQHIATKQQYVLYPSLPVQYGAKKQHAMQESKAPLLDDKAN
jgi:hypothetical protein